MTDDASKSHDDIQRSWLGLYNRPHRDLREFLERAERAGEIQMPAVFSSCTITR